MALKNTSLNREQNDTRPILTYGMLLDHKTKKDLDLIIISIVYGIVLFVITGFPAASPLLTAFLKNELGINDKAFGLIMALPYLTVVIQIPFAMYVAKFGQIKSAFLIFGSFSKTMFMALALLSLFKSGISVGFSAVIVAFIMFFASTFNWIADSALNTWFGALIPNEIKGRYLSTRQMLFTLASLFYTAVLAVILLVFPDMPEKYAVFFTIAAVFGLIDIGHYLKVRGPAHAFMPYNPILADQSGLKFHDFLEPLQDLTYRKYLFFIISWSFAMYIPAPYFNVYLLNDLKVSLGNQILLQQIIPGIATVLLLRNIGKAYDRFGFKPVLLVSCSLIAFLPLTWLFAIPGSWQFLYGNNLLGGAFIVGVDMAIMSLGIFLAPHHKRNPYLAVKNLVMSWLGIGPGILLGGFISDWLSPVLQKAAVPFLRGQQLKAFHILIMLSFFLRILTIVFFTRGLHDPQAVSVRQMFSQIFRKIQSIKL